MFPSFPHAARTHPRLHSINTPTHRASYTINPPTAPLQPEAMSDQQHPEHLPPPPPPPPGFWAPPPPHASGDRKRPFNSLYPPGMPPPPEDGHFAPGFPPPPPGMYPPPPPGAYPFPPPPPHAPSSARGNRKEPGDRALKGPPRNRRTRGGTCQPCKASKVRSVFLKCRGAGRGLLLVSKRSA